MKPGLIREFYSKHCAQLHCKGYDTQCLHRRKIFTPVDKSCTELHCTQTNSNPEKVKNV